MNSSSRQYTHSSTMDWNNNNYPYSSPTSPMSSAQSPSGYGSLGEAPGLTASYYHAASAYTQMNPNGYPAAYPSPNSATSHRGQSPFATSPYSEYSQSLYSSSSSSPSLPPSHHSSRQMHTYNQQPPSPDSYSPSEQNPLYAQHPSYSSAYPPQAQVAVPAYTHATEEPSSYRPFSCEICALSFARQHDLKRHKETHKGEKPFPCNGGCGKAFTRKDALKRHQLVKNCGTMVED